jgi:hypothetical protein
MSGKLTAIAILTATAATLAGVAAVAAAGPVAAKQRIAIEMRGGVNESFVLTPLNSGAATRDVGTATACCWSQRKIVRAGVTVDVNDPQMTLTGKRGTLVFRNRIEWADLPDGWATFTGTWKVIRGTGAYAGLSGGGRVGGVTQPNGNGRSRFEGLVSQRRG